MRILIVGLDGGTWRVFDPLMKEGVMPAIAELVKQGRRTVLWSTLPPVTAPAWTSFMTGTTPAKHGIYEFNNYAGAYRTRFVDSTAIKFRTFWEILSEKGRKVISINVPMTYPPFPVNGFLVSGMLTPGTDSEFTYPPELKKRILEQVEGYRVITTGAVYLLHGLKRFVKELTETERKRLELAKLLLREDWDVAMVHFHSTDIIQHFAFHCLDPSHPAYDSQGNELVKDFYRAADEFVGELVSSLSDDDLLFVISDHGFRPVHSTINLNAVLMEGGFLKVRKGSPFKSAVLAGLRFLKKLDFLNLNRFILRGQKRSRVIESLGAVNLDYSSTRAFSINGWVYGNIYLNLKGREPEGIVEDYEGEREALVDYLLSYRKEGKPLFRKVLLKGRDYEGRPDDLAPDLVVVPEEGYQFSPSPFVKMREAVRPSRPRKDHTGTHEPEGILIIKGRGVEKGEGGQARIWDITPTLLWALGLPVPSHMEGRVLEEFFSPDFRRQRPLRYEEIEPFREGKGRDQQEEFRKRLEDLGYL